MNKLSNMTTYIDNVRSINKAYYIMFHTSCVSPLSLAICSAE